MAASTSAAANGAHAPAFGQGQNADDFPDVSSLKEIARDALVLALNSVRRPRCLLYCVWATAE